MAGVAMSNTRPFLPYPDTLYACPKVHHEKTREDKVRDEKASFRCYLCH